MSDISLITSIGFVLTTIVTLWFFYKASKNKNVLIGIIIWMTVVGILGYLGFYKVENTIPPRFIFLLGPGIIFVVLLFTTKKGCAFSDSLDIKWLTLLHSIRIPVEIVLFYKYLDGYIPHLMTFEGYNFDIISGLSAPFIYYAVFKKNWVKKNGLLIWNFVSLGLLLNILTIAILSAKTPIQKLAFDQPNIGVTFFPFVWLPAIIVPIVLFSHLASIRQLLSLKA